MDEKKQTRPSIQDAKAKLNEAVRKYVEDKATLEQVKQVVDDEVVHLGREVARETIGAWIKENSDATGKAKEAIEAIRQRKVDKLRDKKAMNERISRIARRVVEN